VAGGIVVFLETLIEGLVTLILDTPQVIVWPIRCAIYLGIIILTAYSPSVLIIDLSTILRKQSYLFGHQNTFIVAFSLTSA